MLAREDIPLDSEPDEGGPGEAAEVLDAADEAAILGGTIARLLQV